MAKLNPTPFNIVHTDTGKETWLTQVGKNPRRLVPLCQGEPPPPVEWIRETWDLPEVSQTVAADFVEEVRKWPPEPFLHVHDPLVCLLASALSETQVNALFLRFRARWPFCEPQLREEFAGVFGDRAEGLPKALTFAEVVALNDGDEAQTRLLMANYADHPALRDSAPANDAAADLDRATGLLQRAVDVGWLQDADDFNELVDYLEHGNDWGCQEVFFEPIGGRLCVRFLDDVVWCEIAPFVERVRALADAMRHS